MSPNQALKPKKAKPPPRPSAAPLKAVSMFEGSSGLTFTGGTYSNIGGNQITVSNGYRGKFPPSTSQQTSQNSRDTTMFKGLKDSTFGGDTLNISNVGGGTYKLGDDSQGQYYADDIKEEDEMAVDDQADESPKSSPK